MGNLSLIALPRYEVTQINVRRLVKLVNVVAIASFFLKLPIFPWIIRNLGFTFYSTTYISYCYLTFKYYESLPMSKKTVLTYLVQDMLQMLFLFRILTTLSHWLFSGGTPDVLFSMYPNLACSITSKTPFVLIVIILVWAICSFKAFARIYPNFYLGLNHEKARNAVLVVTLIIWILELSVVLLKDGTFCGKGEILLFHSMTEIPVDIAQTKILMSFILMKTMLASLSKFIHWIAGRNQKNVLSRQEKHIEYSKTCRDGMETGMVTVHEEQCALESNSQIRTTSASQRQPENTSEIIQSFHLRGNAVAPEGVVVPQGKTKVPYILQTSGFVISVFGFFIGLAILFILGIPTEKWFLGYVHVRDLLLYACVLGWVHSSDEISEYAIRKISQFIASYQN